MDFGARGVDSRIGRWLSIDPMFAKYEMLSPYSFAANNPTILMDKDGKEIWIIPKNGGEPVKYIPGKTVFSGDPYVENVIKSLDYVFNNGADVNNIIKTASEDGTRTEISFVRAASNTGYDPRDKSIKWNDKVGAKSKDSKTGKRGIVSPALLLFHELGDRYDHKNANPKKEFDNKAFDDFKKQKVNNPSMGNSSEENVIVNYENKAAEILNSKGYDEGIRDTHNSPGVRVDSPTGISVESSQQNGNSNNEQSTQQKSQQPEEETPHQ